MHSNIYKYRKQGDAIDQYVKRIVENGKKDRLYSILANPNYKQRDLIRLCPGIAVELQRYKQLPNWADEQKILKGQQFFQRYAFPIISLLHIVSLPMCYSCGDGVKALAITKRLQDKVKQRLANTGNFIMDVLNPGSIINGEGVQSLIKVRLFHSLSRYQVQHDYDWGSDEIPANQLDQAGTLLSFSVLILESMEKLGLKIKAEDKEAFHHIWNVIGYYIGIEEDLLIHDFEEASKFGNWMKSNLVKQSPEGEILMKNLLDAYMDKPIAKHGRSFFETLIAYTIGHRAANALNLEVQNNWMNKLIISVFKSFNQFASYIRLFESQLNVRMTIAVLDLYKHMKGVRGAYSVA